MYNLDLEKAEEPDIKFPTSIGSKEKQGNSRKTSTSASLTTLKPLNVCGSQQTVGLADHLTCLLRNLHAGQEATVRIGHGTTGWFKIEKGLWQGCILSPCLFNIYAEYIM